MGERKLRISTRKGDDGTTTLLGTGRMPKSDARVALLGDVDEASSFLGLACAEAREEVAELLLEVQRLLYRTMCDVAMPEEKNAVGEEDLAFVESAFEEWRDRTEIPGEFGSSCRARAGSTPCSTPHARWRGVPSGAPWRSDSRGTIPRG